MTARYLLRRLVLALVVAALITTFLAVMLNALPGDPTRILLGPRATEERVAIVREEMFLDDPVPVQIWKFVRGIPRFDLGNDFVTQRPVTHAIGSALPHTLILAVVSLALALGVGIALGVGAALHPNTFFDHLTRTITVSFITMPGYVVGLFLLLIFAVKLNWLPAFGAGRLGDPVDYARHLILPVVALALYWSGYFTRVVRASMLEVLNTRYIQAARAYGVRARTIHYSYVLKNALIPTVALLGVGLGNVLAGAIFIELIFSRPGLGTLLVNATETHNFPIVRGSVLIISFLFIAANLLADLSYRLLDPRIRIDAARV